MIRCSTIWICSKGLIWVVASAVLPGICWG